MNAVTTRRACLVGSLLGAFALSLASERRAEASGVYVELSESYGVAGPRVPAQPNITAPSITAQPTEVRVTSAPHRACPAPRGRPRAFPQRAPARSDHSRARAPLAPEWGRAV